MNCAEKLLEPTFFQEHYQCGLCQAVPDLGPNCLQRSSASKEELMLLLNY